jgi:hypothetical protein
MKKRSLGTMIILALITLGIYMIYWYINFQSQLKQKTNEGFGGFGHLLATLFTFGIYYIYWQYAAGKRLAKLGASDNSVLYLVLSLFSLGWLNVFLMQDQANKLSD